MLADASEYGVFRPAEGAVVPAGVLVPQGPFPPLQPPLQRIIYDPPPLVELGYGPI